MSKIKRKDGPEAFLNLFFPIHYSVGMTMEDALRSGVLTRQQTVIMWLIHSKGADGKTMRRKDIVKDLSYWFDLTSSAISKALRSLAKPPLGLLTISEDPNSGREKVVTLTPEGEKFLVTMMDNGKSFIKILTDEMTDEEMVRGIQFFRRLTEIFTEYVEQEED